MNMLISERPVLGIIGAVAGWVASVLSWIGYVTPLIGFAGAVFGLCAGYYTFRIKRAEWKRMNAYRKLMSNRDRLTED